MTIAKVFIDTGGFAALYNRQDTHHEKAARIWSGLLLKRPLLYTSNFVLAETITLLRKRAGFQASVQFGEALFASSIVRILRVNASQESQSWTLYKKFSDQDFSFTDCSSFALMRELGILNAFAFDHHFSIFGFELLSD